MVFIEMIDFAKVELTVDNVKVTYPFVNDKLIGRVDIKMNDHYEDAKLFKVSLIL